MSMIARGLALALLLVVGAAGAAADAVAEQRGGELAALAAWAAKSKETATIDGKVARALGLNQDGKPVRLTAVTTAYLDGSRSVHLVPGGQIVFSQGQATRGRWYLSNQSGALLRVIEWVPTSANPQPAAPAATMPAFREIKAFWKNQLGRPVR
jgi:hypothetical protein